MIRRRTSLKSWAKFQKIRNIDWERINRVIPSAQRNFFDTINEEELELLKKVRVEEREKIYQRNNLILDFFFYTGIRANELINIKHSDYDPKRKTLWILGKGNKVRYILLPTRLANKFAFNSSNYFFENSFWKTKLSLRNVEDIVKKRVQKSPINKIITPHSFRRSFATHLHNKGVHLTTIQKLLGHSNINTTSNYIHNDWNYLHEDYSKIWKT